MFPVSLLSSGMMYGLSPEIMRAEGDDVLPNPLSPFCDIRGGEKADCWSSGPFKDDLSNNVSVLDYESFLVRVDEENFDPPPCSQDRRRLLQRRYCAW